MECGNSYKFFKVTFNYYSNVKLSMQTCKNINIFIHLQCTELFLVHFTNDESQVQSCQALQN